MVQSQKLAGSGGLRHADEIIALYGGLVRGLKASEMGEIASYRRPILPNAEVPELFPEKLIAALKSMDEIARIMTGHNEATSAVTRGTSVVSGQREIGSPGCVAAGSARAGGSHPQADQQRTGNGCWR